MPGTLTNATGGETAGRDQRTRNAALLDVQGVAALLQCSPRHVYRLSDSGRMPRPHKLGALVRWNRAALLDWIGGGCKPVRGGAA
jgi:excisionase family DNA binding protein